MQIDVWFDPGCPWTWNTARWLMTVGEARSDLELVWRPFSLDIKNADVERPPRTRARYEFTRRALRVIERARTDVGDHAVGPLYVELGRRIHHDDELEPADELEPDLADVLAAVGLDPDLASAADDEALDAPIESSMRLALELAGEDAGAPILGIASGDEKLGVFGPIFSSAPAGDDALVAFDAVVALATRPEFTELKRVRRSGPETPERP